MTIEKKSRAKDLRSQQPIAPQTEQDQAAPDAEAEVFPFLSELAEELQEAGMDPANPQVQRVLAMMAAYRGPIPPPELIAKYEEVRPGSADEIFNNFNRQVEHRLAIEKQQVAGSEIRQSRAQFFALLVAVLSLLASGFLVYNNDSWTVAVAAVLLVAVGIGGPSVATIVARILSRRPRD